MRELELMDHGAHEDPYLSGLFTMKGRFMFAWSQSMVVEELFDSGIVFVC